MTPYRKETNMSTTENTPVDQPEPIELKAAVSRKVLILGSAAVGALSVVVLSALKKSRRAEIVVLEPAPAATDEV